MASASFELDDQSDEDFFDKLVDDDIDFAGSSAPSAVAGASAIANLSISEVVSSKRVDFGDNIGFRVTDSSGEIDNRGSDSKLESESGKVKLVQWNSFGSDSKIPGDGGAGYGSDSDIFNALGESLDLSFSNEGVQSSVKEVVLESSVAYLGSSDEQRQENSGELNVVGAGFGSYSDLFNGSGESSDDPFAIVGDKSKSVVPSSVGNVALDSSDYEQKLENSHELGANEQDLSNSQYWESAYPGWKYDQNTGQWYQAEGDAANMNGTVNSNANLQESFLLSNSISVDQQTDSYQIEYPAHMVFDPQYPGWYYDTISQEWRSLDSYSPAVEYRKGSDTQQHIKTIEQSYQAQNIATQESVADWDASLSTYNQQNARMWQTQQTAQSLNIGYSGSQQLGNQNAINDHSNHSLDDRYTAEFQSVNHQIKEVKSQERQFLPAQFNNLDVNRFALESVQRQSSNTFSHAREERTSDKRPPHALVTFGFGGKLVVMKDHSSVQANSAYRTQDSPGDVISVLNLMEVVMEKPETIAFETGACNYIRELCHQSFPGPLVGGNAGSKELNKWIEEKISDYRDRELSRLLLSLLKISVQYYGKLRSTFGNDQILKENDSPESAVAELFASARRSEEYGAFTKCLQNVPSEAQIQGIALEVQNLLVSGRKKEALERAQEGQLWGPALALSSQLGAEFYSDTMKKMALKHLVAGSPLRTLCLLIAGQPADVFSNAEPNSSNAFQQSAQVKANCTLEEWKNNLAIITANRTKDDELVIIHLGDCLWKDTGEITAAHICYLVAEANFEHHSESSRLCLIGADHWKFPRTYATPEAIQRTELYEYSKVLGNSQFLLLPFQPYKLVYANMLAEVGRISDSLKYCQAMLKSLKTGRAPEMEAWRQLVLSLEERIKTHQQGGYGTNLTSTKLVGKLLTFFDSTAHRVVGGLPPPVPSTMQNSGQHFETAPQLGVSGQSAQPSPLLIPSISMDPISARGTDDLQMPYKSNSEPDFSKSPRKADQSKKDNSANTREKTSAPSGSRFGRLGSQLFQKTVGLVIRSRPDKQAKLGEPNNFYFDEKLKRWVEQGAEPPSKQEALEPPPTMTAFLSTNGSPQTERFESVASPDMKTPSPNSSSPPIPPGSNQFSARHRSGARSRYVDTFNKSGGASANLFRSPSTPAAKPAGGFNPKFFVPAAVSSPEATLEPHEEPTTTGNRSDSSPFPQTTESPPPIPLMAMQRFPSMDTIVAKGDSSVPPQARRRASWGGSLNNAQSPVMATPPVHMPDSSPASLRRNSGDELHEVQI